jgi:glycine dehydrogenase subunit 1
LHALWVQGILGGLDVTGKCPERRRALLVCATEIKTEADLKRCAGDMAIIAKRSHPAPGAIKPHYP